MFERHPRGASGQVVIVVAVAMPVLFAMLALLVDLGFAYTGREKMRAAADAAALAGARAMAQGGTDAQVLAGALDFAARNGGVLDQAASRPFYVDVNGANVGWVGSGMPEAATGLEVRVGVSQNSFFGGAVGRSVLPINMRSRAVVDVEGGLSPFGVPVQSYQVGQTYWIEGIVVGWGTNYHSNNKDVGLLDYRVHNKKSDITYDIAYGYTGAMLAGFVLDQPKGEMDNAVKDGVQERLGRGLPVVTCPVVEVYQELGGNSPTQKKVKSFAAFSLDTPNNRSASFDGSRVEGIYQGTVAQSASVSIRLATPSQ